MEKSNKKRLRKCSKNECVEVIVRCRPMSGREENAENVRVVDVWPSRGVIEITNPKDNVRENKKMFTYDAVYDWFSTQQSLYEETVRPLVASVMEGFNGCVFAYGQTGTGKTHTMEGVANPPDNQGMIPRAFEQIWTHINRTSNTNFLVFATYLEIYMEQIRDLLVKKRVSKSLEIHEVLGEGVYIPDLQKKYCKSPEDMLKVMAIGNKNRTVGCTNMNDHSSRSHAIFQICIEMIDEESGTIRVGKLNLIDLAGSERQSKTGATADRLKEASKINKALSSLGNVISALAENSPHIPYRDSKLTRLLQDSLGGNSKTIMIANIGPASSNYEETLTTLRYAHRAKNINNKPVQNEDPKDAKLREYQDEISRLKALIAERRGKEAEKKMIIAAGDHDSEGSAGETESEEEDIESSNIQIESSNIQVCGQKLKLMKTIEFEKMKTEELAKKLALVESQFVRGGKNIFDSVNEHKQQIERQQQEIIARQKREREMQQKLEEEETTITGIRETYSNLQQELEVKTNRLNKFHDRWLALKQEIKDIKTEHIRDRQLWEENQEELVKQLRMKCIMLDNFIPPDVRVKLFSQVEFDENKDDWRVGSAGPTTPEEFCRGKANPKNRRPLSDLAMKKINTTSQMKYRNENVLDLAQDTPVRTTQNYKFPAVTPIYRAVIDCYYNHEKKNNRMEVNEPPPSFAPRAFPRRELEKRYEKNARGLAEFNLGRNLQTLTKEEAPTRTEDLRSARRGYRK